MWLTNPVKRNMRYLTWLEATVEQDGETLVFRREDGKQIRVWMTPDDRRALILALGGGVQIPLIDERIDCE